MIRILLSTRLGERRWTQADLARATGIRPSTINDYYHEFAERVNLEHFHDDIGHTVNGVLASGAVVPNGRGHEIIHGLAMKHNTGQLPLA